MSTAADRRKALTALLEGEGTTLLSPPILVPAGPYFDLAGEEFRRRLLLTSGSDGEEYCLRPDFTLPLAQTYLAQKPGAAAYAYQGPVFRQRIEGPSEFEQAGLELIGHTDPDAALDQVFAFALDALEIYGIDAPLIRLGSVALFEALLASADMPDVWRPRLRHRFGHPEMLGALIARLPDPHGAKGAIRPPQRQELVAKVTERMQADGLSLAAGRSPEEIADRFIEKQALAAAYVPDQTIGLFTAYLDIAGPVDEAVETIAELPGLDREALGPALAALAAHADRLRARAPGARLVFDAGFAPRLDYYTGLVFEFAGTGGAILVSGGQYDRLLERLGARAPAPASGCALWVDRLDEEAQK